MIIKSIRCKSTKARIGLRSHVLHGEENEEIHILRGTEDDILDYVSDAVRNEKHYAVRHFILAPLKPASRTEIFHLVDMLANEFGFNGLNTVLVEHVKRRANDSAFNKHWHLLVPEYDASKGRVLSSSNDHLRHEYIARTFEFEFSQPFTLGAHTDAVIRRLRADGKTEIADALSNAIRDSDERHPRSAFTHGAHQRAARVNSDLPADRQFAREAWSSTRDRSSLEAALATTGLTISRGEKLGEHVLWRGDVFIGSLRRFARISKAEMTLRMENPNDGRTPLPEKLGPNNFGSYGENGSDVERDQPPNSIVGEYSTDNGIYRGFDEIAKDIDRRHGKDKYFARGTASSNSDTAHTLGNRSRIAEPLDKNLDNCIQDLEKLSSRVQKLGYFSKKSPESYGRITLMAIERTLSELVMRRDEVIDGLTKSQEREKVLRISLNEGHIEVNRLQDEIDKLRDKSVRRFLCFRWSDRKALQRMEHLKSNRQAIQESVRVTSIFAVDAVAKVAKSESALKNVQSEIFSACELRCKLIEEAERNGLIERDLTTLYPEMKFVGFDHMARIMDFVARDTVDVRDGISTHTGIMSP